MNYRIIKHTGYVPSLTFISGGAFSKMSGTANAISFLIAGEEAYQNINVKDICEMTCTANLGVVTPDCSGSGKTSCLDSLNPAIVGGYINNIVPVILNDAGTETELS